MRRVRSAIVAVLVLIAAAVGLAAWLIAREVSSQSLQFELEARLSRALATPVTIGELTVSPRNWIRLEAREVRAWPGAGDYGLEVPRALASIDPLSLLIGELRVRKLQIDGAVLRVGALGRPARAAAPPSIESAEPQLPQPSELLGPLLGLEAALRYLLEFPTLSSVLEVHDSRLEFDSTDPARAFPTQLREVEARIVHHHFTGESRLALSGRVMEAERDLGAIELAGERSRSGRMRISLQLDALALAISDAYVSGLGSEARVDGSMSGEIVYESPEVGSGHLGIDLTCERLRSVVPVAGGGPPARTELPRVDLDASLVITPESIAVHEGVIATAKTRLRTSGRVARPLQSESMADLSVEFDEVEVSQVRHLMGWLPQIKREEAAAIVAPLKSGRLVSLRASGGATLAGWQNFLAGRTRTMPQDFRLGAELADTVIWVSDSDRIEKLSGRLQWVGARAELVGATAVFNDTALPRLDLVVDGFPNFFAGDPAARKITSGGEPLTGLGTLWRSLGMGRKADSPDVGTIVELQLDYLDHPMFLWPVRDLDLAIKTETRGLRVESVRGHWAGVPIDGKAEWLFLPDERVRVELSAGAPGKLASDPIPKNTWARGRFKIGPVEGERWRQRAARGDFEASADRIRIRDLAIDLEPSGVVDANGRVEISEVDAVPFQLSFDLKSGDAIAIAQLFGLPSNQISGRVDLAGSFEGTLLPDVSIYKTLRGLLQVSASDGVIRKKAPPIAAVSRASEALEDFDPREVIRYRRLETILEFSDGRLRTDAFSLDGPDIGVLASGDVELMTVEMNIDGKVALFLFRKLDRVLGKIPILNQLLLGTDANLVAAYFQVTGPWENPDVKPILLPGSAGPASIVLQGVPLFVKRGFSSLGSIIRPEPSEPESPPVAEPQSPPVAEPESPPVAEPESPPVAEPESPPVAEPESPPVAEPESPPVAEPESLPVDAR